MLVSVVIPCFNVEEYITESVQSVINQTYKHIEIICIDNNSTDNTYQILKNLKIEFPNLIVDRELKAGANAARNKGLEIAKGSWIQFLDADDLITPTKIEHQLKLISTASDKVAFVAAASLKMNIHNIEMSSSNIEKNPFIAAFISQCGNTCANLWEKESLLEIGKWDEEIRSSQETNLMLRLVLINKNYIIDVIPLTIIRERLNGQISQSDPIKKWKQYLDIRISYLDELKILHPKEYNNNIQKLLDFLMISVLSLGKYDKKSALFYFNTFIKYRWNSPCQFSMSKLKFYFIKFFGLRTFLSLTNINK